MTSISNQILTGEVFDDGSLIMSVDLRQVAAIADADDGTRLYISHTWIWFNIPFKDVETVWTMCHTVSEY